MADPIKNGTCVFFKEFQTTAHPRKHSKLRFKYLGFGVLLGNVPPFGKGPTTGDLYRSLGAIGYISFDDVGEFLGAEMGAKCVEEFEKKYTPKPPTNADAATDPAAVVPQGKIAEVLDQVQTDDGAGKQVEDEMLRTYEESEPKSNIVDINGKPIV